ncbi:hypothetical protein, partial [Aeromonas jandaei]|uniref:hypothetical protein n=1 Tax=Aeromonas jandaei TaxID=650 RepID=UPI001E371DE3
MSRLKVQLVIFLPTFNASCMQLKIDVTENLENIWGKLGKLNMALDAEFFFNFIMVALSFVFRKILFNYML